MLDSLDHSYAIQSHTIADLRQEMTKKRCIVSRVWGCMSQMQLWMSLIEHCPAGLIWDVQTQAYSNLQNAFLLNRSGDTATPFRSGFEAFAKA